ncbi:MAG TPA: outer membrane beta-barrel protein [Sphingomicrobium sp.]|nr:outer membrane beta-barrel protein [Sphingomicrobium sp.]
MRKSLLTAVAATALLSTPAIARENSWYAGLEGGVTFGAEAEIDVDIDDGDSVFESDDALELDYSMGMDIDALVGYDFGMVKTELELAYKNLNADELDLDDEVAEDLGIADDDFDADGDTNIVSLMGNVLLDFGNDDGWGAYLGGGVGYAWVKALDFDDDKDSAFAWQLIAGLRYAVSDNIDLGLKYRYFQTGKLNFADEFDDGEIFFDIDTHTKIHSHSLLLSLIYNFAPPPPPEPERG